MPHGQRGQFEFKQRVFGNSGLAGGIHEVQRVVLWGTACRCGFDGGFVSCRPGGFEANGSPDHVGRLLCGGSVATGKIFHRARPGKIRSPRGRLRCTGAAGIPQSRSTNSPPTAAHSLHPPGHGVQSGLILCEGGFSAEFSDGVLPPDAGPEIVSWSANDRSSAILVSGFRKRIGASREYLQPAVSPSRFHPTVPGQQARQAGQLHLPRASGAERFRHRRLQRLETGRASDEAPCGRLVARAGAGRRVLWI